jgi:HD-GYP domain-containing protein (c-di-GMP phosphodiesterase class II)
MSVPFAVRVFLLSFVPIAGILIGSFWTIQNLLGERVKDGLRASLRQSHRSISRARENFERRNSRMLTVLAENPSLKAGFELVHLESNSSEARRTLEDQLWEISETLTFDLIAATGPSESVLAGVVRQGGRQISRMDPRSAPPLSSGLVFLGDEAYVLARVPVNLSMENLGALYVGRVFDLSEFAGQTVLTRHGTVVRANLPGVSDGKLETALEPCAASQECEVTLHGERYLCLPFENIPLGDGYLLRSLQSVDAASRPLRSVVQNVFLAAGTIALLAISLVSMLSAKSIVMPLTGLIARLKESERSGVLTQFETTSSAREVTQLIEAFNRAAAAIVEARDRLALAYREFTHSLTNAIDARDLYTAGHSRRVSAYAVAIAQQMDLPDEEIEVIRDGALLHDLGKIGISDLVLQKPGKLTREELELIQQHPSIGRRIIERVDGLGPYLNIIELHHENHDGSGYPWRLAGEQTPRDARIVHVADAFDAMTSNRTYRKAMSPEKALRVLQEYAGTQFDPEVVDAFARVNYGELMASEPPEETLDRPGLERLGQALNAVEPSVPEKAARGNSA